LRDEVEFWGVETEEQEERFREIVEDRTKNSPFYTHIGMKIVGLGPGESRMRITVEDFLRNAGGIVHGGAIASLADASAGVALATLVPGGSKRVITLEQKINFMAAAWEGNLHGTGRVLRKGKEIGVVEAEVRDDKGTLVAKSMATFLIIR
jgi:uncharacterized protein (TIGR00369 family)